MRINYRSLQTGFSHLAIISAVLIVAGIAGIGYKVMNMSRAASVSPAIVGIGGKCLDNYYNRLANGNLIDLFDCNGSPAQQWRYTASTIRLGSTAYCLDIPSSSRVARTNVELWTCNGGSNQTWVQQSNGSFKNPETGLCLDDKWAVTTNKNPIWIYACNGTAAQKWTVIKATTLPGPITPPAPAPKPTPVPTPVPAPAPAPTPPASSSPSGQAMPVGNISGWRQVFTDDFTTSAPLGSFLNVYGNRWSSYDGCCDTAKIGTWSSYKTLSVSNGMMDQWLHVENGTPYSSAALPKLRQLYGRYAVRYKADNIPGYAMAWLQWPDSENWPTDGEIDFPEGKLDGPAQGFAHYANPNGGQDYANAGVQIAGSWHTAVTEWSPGKIQFFMDGKLVGGSTKQVPSKSMHWVLQSETAYGARPPANASGHIKVDWVAAYARQ